MISLKEAEVTMPTEIEQTRFVTASPELEKALSEFTQCERETIIQSVNGKLLGRFVPFPDCEELPWVKQGLTEDEYVQRVRESKKYGKLKDFWKKMGVK